MFEASVVPLSTIDTLEAGLRIARDVLIIAVGLAGCVAIVFAGLALPDTLASRAAAVAADSAIAADEPIALGVGEDVGAETRPVRVGRARFARRRHSSGALPAADPEEVRAA